jgi:hypothetical protein
VKHRGHPIRGAIAGLFFGLFLSVDLVIFGVVALDSNVLALLPILGLAAGVALGMTAPLHRRSTEPNAAAEGADGADGAPVLVSPEPGPGAA